MKLLGINTPTSNQSASNKKYADDVVQYSYKNAIIGGDFGTNPWQRGTSLTVGTGIYTADRWVTHQTIGFGGNRTISKNSDAPTFSDAGLNILSSLNYAFPSSEASVPSTSFSIFSQPIEGYVWSRFAQKALTLSFWVKSTKTGIFSVCLTNEVDRSFVSTYTINSSNTWEKKIINISASPSGGTWNYTTSMGAALSFGLAIGSNFTTSSLDTWNSDSKFGATTQVNALDNNTNIFRLANIQLEVGNQATEFEQLDRNQVKYLCQRYYQRITEKDAEGNSEGVFTEFSNGFANNSVRHFFTYLFPVEMRATPTVSASSGTNNFYVNRPGGDQGITTLSATNIRANSMCPFGDGSGNTAGNPGSVAYYGSNGGWIDMSAEL